MKKLLFLLLIFPFAFQLKAQTVNCRFQEPLINLDFGSGYISDGGSAGSFNYRRVNSTCPTDGHYTYTPYTSDCFRGDWLTLAEDHTPGDVDGNMMLVNASPSSGTFLTTTITGLKKGTTYEFAVWMMNVCKISEKCPFPLLPNITILLQTPDGKIIAQFGTGELVRGLTPQWKQYRSLFNTPASETAMTLIMINNAPGGCGNDFALDDITFSECVLPKPVVTSTRKTPVVVKKQPPTPAPVVKKETPAPVVVKKQPPIPAPVVKKEVPAPVIEKKQPPTPAPVLKKETPAPVVVKKQPPIPAPVVKKEVPAPVKKQPQTSRIAKPQADSPAPAKRQPEISQIAKPQAGPPVDSMPAVKLKPAVFPPPPRILTTRANLLIKQIETEAGDIRLDLYDNGQIDGDTVSVYHNNVLVVSNARLSEKPITFRIAIDAAHPHHELVMVAHNLGSIPPNTSLMVVNAGSKRYEVFLSSTEQKNAKVILDLKE